MKIARYLVLVGLSLIVACGQSFISETSLPQAVVHTTATNATDTTGEPSDPLGFAIVSVSDFTPLIGSLITFSIEGNIPSNTLVQLELIEITGGFPVGAMVAKNLQQPTEVVVASAIPNAQNFVSSTFSPTLAMSKGGKRTFFARAVNNQGVVFESATREVFVITPVANPVIQVAIGGNHTCVLLTNRDVRCWGFNFSGQLGLGNTNSIGNDEAPNSVPPIQFPTGFRVESITAGQAHNCALSEQGKVICWGNNQFGQLGYGDTLNRGGTPQTQPNSLTPIDLGSGFDNVQSITSGSSASHTCAVSQSQSFLIKCWGVNSQGQLGQDREANTNIGDNPNELAQIAPIFLQMYTITDVGGYSPVKQIVVGEFQTCALLVKNTLHCWGGNNLNFSDPPIHPQLFPRPTDQQMPSRNVIPIPDARKITSGSAHKCILINTSIRCWGRNFNGELGNSALPLAAEDNRVPDPTFPVTIDASTQISSGSNHNCASQGLLDITIRCWGLNNNGQLGYGHTITIGDNEPVSSAGTVKVNTDITQGGITKIFSGGSHNCVIFESGNIKCWGRNDVGQLGYGHNIAIGDNEFPSSVGIVPLF
jgi:alpha-tubulin suppressor-like RCC1 family protein